MSATAATLAGRRLAESLMVDACTITVPSGAEPVIDPDSLEQTIPQTTLYAGPCQVAAPPDAGAQQSTAQAGERLVYEQTRTIKVPAATVNIPVGASVLMTASLLDAELVGRTFTVRGSEHKTYVTARRLLCEETTA